MRKKTVAFTSMFLMYTFVFGQGIQKTKPVIKTEEITYHGIDRRHISRIDKQGFDEYKEYNADGTVSKIYIVEFDKKNNKYIYILMKGISMKKENLTK